MWVDLEAADEHLIQRAGEVIRVGGVVLYPADTIYGLGCDPWSTAALERIYHLKRRPSQKGMLVLLPGFEWLERLGGGGNRWAAALAERFWPGPLTLVVEAAPGLPPPLLGEAGTIGLRFPDSRFLRSWMEAIPGPLVSTSANRSGEAVPADPAELERLFGAEVDLLLLARSFQPTAASTVVDVSGDRPRIVRRGSLVGEVEAFLDGGARSSS